jgi:hypothetical protein
MEGHEIRSILNNNRRISKYGLILENIYDIQTRCELSIRTAYCQSSQETGVLRASKNIAMKTKRMLLGDSSQNKKCRAYMTHAFLKVTSYQHKNQSLISTYFYSSISLQQL